LFIAGKSLVPVSTATGKPGGPIGVAGTSPVVSPDGRTLYVATRIRDRSAVQPVDLATGQACQPVLLPGSVYDMTVSPDGRTLYVAGSRGIVPVDTATGAAGTAIETRYKTVASMVITPDGRTVRRDLEKRCGPAHRLARRQRREPRSGSDGTAAPAARTT
jgi:DNA-binding beta-propeller fold protein YncE